MDQLKDVVVKAGAKRSHKTRDQPPDVSFQIPDVSQMCIPDVSRLPASLSCSGLGFRIGTGLPPVQIPRNAVALPVTPGGFRPLPGLPRSAQPDQRQFCQSVGPGCSVGESGILGAAAMPRPTCSESKLRVTQAATHWHLPRRPGDGLLLTGMAWRP